MLSSWNFIPVFLLSGALHGLFLAAALLFLRRGPRTANRLLGALVLIFSAQLAWHAFVALKFAVTPFALFPLAFLFGPLFYFYTLALTQKEFAPAFRQLWHGAPAILCARILTMLQVTASSPERFFAALGGLALAHLFIYLIAIAKRLREHELRLKEKFSSLERINLVWLRKLFGLFVLDWAALVLWQIYGRDPLALHLIWTFAALALYAIGYMGLQQPEIFAGANGEAEAKQAGKYEKSTLTPEKAEEHLQKLLALMRSEKPYRESALNLPALAKRMAIPTHHLSQIINDKLRQNFFEFVNHYRIEEAQTLLRDPSQAHLNVAAIGFDCGFSSISAFNSAFKKFTGTTPSRFRKNTSAASHAR